VAPMLASAGYRVIVPYLRGYGPTILLCRIAPPQNGSRRVRRPQRSLPQNSKSGGDHD
jgi:hypothetical protein